MKCPECARADRNPTTGLYHVNCDGCKARALAGGREVFESQRTGKKTPEYRAALTKVFGQGNEDTGHELVRQWAKKIRTTQKGNT